jgi:hypothetical protein
MKTLKHLLKNGSTLSLLFLCFGTSTLGAGIAMGLLATLRSPHIHAVASNSVKPAIAVPGNTGSNRLSVATLGPSDALQQADSRAKSASGSVLIHGALSGSVKPVEDQPWRHWLQ